MTRRAGRGRLRGSLAGCHRCNRADLPPAVTAALRPRGATAVPLAWLCGDCAGDPRALRRCVGDFRAAFRGATVPPRFAAAPDRDEPAPALTAVLRDTPYPPGARRGAEWGRWG